MTNSLPWTVLADGAHIVDPNAWTIAHCYGDAAEGNARLIVAAVNAYAELLASAEWAVSGVKTPDTPSIAQLRAAIAKAEELDAP
jgi:hypothetical protein